MSRKLQQSSSSLQERHDQWMTKYDKVYKDDAEKEKRFKIFKDNVEYIESFNAVNNKPYMLSVNHLADLTLGEFKASRNGYKKRSLEFTTTSFKYEYVTDIPEAIDWRIKGAVTPIKDQGQCGQRYKLHHPSSAPRLCMHVCPLEELLAYDYPRIFRITLLASPPSTPGMPFVLSKSCLAPNQPWIFRWFNKLQQLTPLASNYLQLSYKLPSLITVAFNCLHKVLHFFTIET
ncbi:hypothetical protein TSUD_93100 [Trifolium subterraneum]|uniref:Cathepsin propeptide inhibitor domain-containing protein n=1 Tax=Trifolium subterraneum TaxID=3900 RepID=A0A2Z6NL87_TRISU|nr:hypothetical protein TSUD_93100 [Trifolium subterraneum]